MLTREFLEVFVAITPVVSGLWVLFAVATLLDTDNWWATTIVKSIPTVFAIGNLYVGMSLLGAFIGTYVEYASWTLLGSVVYMALIIFGLKTKTTATSIKWNFIPSVLALTTFYAWYAI